MLYVIYPDVEIWQYMLQDYKEDRDGIRIRALNQNCKKWQLAMRKIFNNSRLPSVFLFNQRLRKELSALKGGDSVLLCDYADPVLAKAINSLVSPVVKKHFWIWNPVTDKDRSFYSHAFKVMNVNGFRLATFDKHDAKIFNIDYYPQFYRMDMDKKEDFEILYDFYFIGASKGRDKIINSLNETLSSKYKTYLKLVNKKSDSITYSENINNVIHSRCLIDIVQAGQSGLTLRPLEALAYNKKLISNNKNLIKCDFYHKDNIFILGIDKLEDIDTFMQSPCRQIEDSIRSKYDTANWVKNFMNYI